MSYRRSDIKYRRNEAFVDVIENVNHLMSATGTVLQGSYTFILSLFSRVSLTLLIP